MSIEEVKNLGNEVNKSEKEGWRYRGMKSILEDKKVRGLEGKLFNYSSLNKTPYRQQNDKNRSRFTVHSSPDNSYTSKKAFTLAEVLVVIAIVGVIAAMTLPTVIHKIQMAVLHAQFKKAYSAISNAIEKTRVDTEYSLRCDYSSGYEDCGEFNNKFQSQFKVIKICEKNAYANGCMGNIKGIDKVKVDKNSSAYPNNMNMLFDANLDYKHYVFFTSGGFSVAYYSKPVRDIYIVDTNGIKPPNKWGYDVYVFDTYKNKINCVAELSNFYETGGKGCKDMIINKK